MKKIVKQKSQNEQILEMLKKLASRMEDATIDISSIKSDLKFVNLRLNGVEHNTEIMKVDLEKMREDMAIMKKDIKYLKTNVDDITKTTAEILKNAASQDEIENLSSRIASLEQS